MIRRDKRQSNCLNLSITRVILLVTNHLSDRNSVKITLIYTKL